jgi:hypothetical protein
VCGHAREDEYHWNLLPTEWMKDCAKSESTSYPYCSNRTGSRGSSSSVTARVASSYQVTTLLRSRAAVGRHQGVRPRSQDRSFYAPVLPLVLIHPSA